MTGYIKAPVNLVELLVNVLSSWSSNLVAYITSHLLGASIELNSEYIKLTTIIIYGVFSYILNVPFLQKNHITFFILIS